MTSRLSSGVSRKSENSLVNGSLKNRNLFHSMRRLGNRPTRRRLFADSNTSTSVENYSNESEGMSSEASTSPKMSFRKLQRREKAASSTSFTNHTEHDKELSYHSSTSSLNHGISSPSASFNAKKTDSNWAGHDDSSTLFNLGSTLESECGILDVQEYYQLAFQEPEGGLLIPICARKLDVEYKLPCNPNLLQNGDENETLLNSVVPYYYQEAFEPERDKFLTKSFIAISHQLNRDRSRQLNLQRKSFPVVLNSFHNEKSYYKSKSQMLQEWKACDGEIITLRREIFNMLIRIIPDLNVLPCFDCNTKQVDDILVEIINSLYQSNPPLSCPSAISTRQMHAVVTLCKDPLRCLKKLQTNVLTLLGLLCPFCDIPSSITSQELLRLIKFVHLAPSDYT